MNQQSESTESIQQEAEEIVKQQAKVTEKIERLAVKSAQVGERGVETFGKVYDAIFSGAVSALDNAIPEEQERALRQVFEGLSDAGNRFAHAIKLTFEEAKAESRVFNDTEIQQAKEELAALESLAVETALKYRERVGSELREQINRIVEHSKNTSSDLGNAVVDALRVVKDHPVELVSDSAKSGVALSKSIAHSLLQSSADLLSSAAKSLEKDKH